MENYNSQMEEKNPLKKWVILLSVLSFIFLCTTLYFGFFSKPVFNQQYIQTVEEKDNLQSELNALIQENNKIKTK